MANDREALRREGFVEFKQINVGKGQLGPLKRGPADQIPLALTALLKAPGGAPVTAVAAGTTSTGGTPREVVAFVGDNILDFPGMTQASVKANEAALDGFGVKFFILPNPMYGSWQ